MLVKSLHSLSSCSTVDLGFHHLLLDRRIIVVEEMEGGVGKEDESLGEEGVKWMLRR